MIFFRTFLGYMKWHYGKALANTFPFWNNILFFLLNFFSFKKIFQTFFTPWKKIPAPGAPISTFKKDLIYVENILMIILGVVLRLIILTIGVFSCLFFILILPVTLVMWLALPLLIAFLVLSGLVLLIFS